MISTATRLKLDEIIKRISNGGEVKLEERLQLHKFANRFPMIAGKLEKALRASSYEK